MNTTAIANLVAANLQGIPSRPHPCWFLGSLRAADESGVAVGPSHRLQCPSIHPHIVDTHYHVVEYREYSQSLVPLPPPSGQCRQTLSLPASSAGPIPISWSMISRSSLLGRVLRSK